MLNLSSLNQRVNALTAKINSIVPSTPPDLDAVLTAGNTADNSIILTDGTDNTTFTKDGLVITNTGGSSTHSFQLLNLVETGVGSAILNPNALTIIDTLTTGGTSNPLLRLQNNNTTAGGTTFETYKNDTPTSTGGDVIGIWTSTCNTNVGKTELTRISSIAYGTTTGNNDGGITFGVKVNGTLNKMMDINGGVGTGAIQVFKPIQASGTGSTDLVLDATSSAGTGDVNITAKGDVDITSNGAGGAVDITAVSNVNITATGDNLVLRGGTLAQLEGTGTGANVILKPETTAGDLVLEGANIESGSAGGNSGQHLRIKLNGTYYKIALLND